MTFLGVFGHVVVDHLFTIPELPHPDTSVPVTGRRRRFGGTAANLARAAARLGVPTALAAFVGADLPEEYRAALEADGVDLTDLRVLEDGVTPAAWIFLDEAGGQMTFIDQGAVADSENATLQVHTVRESEVVHLGTGRPAYYRRVRDRALEAGKRVAFDPSQEIHYLYDPEAFRGLLEGAHLFFANEVELRRALGLAGREAPRDLLEWADVLVLTRGDRGSEIHTADHRWQIPPIPPTTRADPTGAGDAFRAGFYAGLYRDHDLPMCGLLGAAVASYSLERLGPQEGLPDWDAAWERATDHTDAVEEG